jgi:myo-inositol 2-dehydrogenase / D-chiro-inositol 1-dehydrogenase
MLVNEAVRYGIIGTGMMGVEHLQNLQHLDGAIVTALADPNPASLARAAKVANDASVACFSDYRDLLASGLCDAVVVASPNMTHVEVLLDVLATGTHVLAEKPLCTTVPDCQRVIAAAADSPSMVWMGLEYRYMPPVARLIDKVRSGATGTVRMMAIREHRFPFLRKVDNWNRFTANTGGTLVEKCCHFFDLMRLVVDDTPIRVTASGGQDVNHLDEIYDGRRSDILDNAYVIVEWAGGARSMLDLCMFAEASKNEQEISVVGERGKVEALLPESIVRVGNRSDGVGSYIEDAVDNDAIAYRGYHHGASYLEHRDFLHAICTNTPPAVTLDDGLWSVAIGQAAHRSIDEGRSVLLSEVL